MIAIFQHQSYKVPPDEDWTLPLEACEKRNENYDLWVQGKLIAEIPDFESAKQEIGKYIDE